MDARSWLKGLAFLLYVPALLLSLCSLFLPWVYLESCPNTPTMGKDVSPLVPPLVAVGAAVATVISKTRGVRRLASTSHIALGLLALAVSSEVFQEAKAGHGPYFGVELSPTTIRVESGLKAFALSGALLVASGLIETFRPHGR